MPSPTIPVGQPTQAILLQLPSLETDTLNSNGVVYPSDVVNEALVDYTPLPLYGSALDTSPDNIVGQVQNPVIIDGTMVVDVFTTNGTIMTQILTGTLAVLPNGVGTLNGTTVSSYELLNFYVNLIA